MGSVHLSDLVVSWTAGEHSMYQLSGRAAGMAGDMWHCGIGKGFAGNFHGQFSMSGWQTLGLTMDENPKFPSQTLVARFINPSTSFHLSSLFEFPPCVSSVVLTLPSMRTAAKLALELAGNEFGVPRTAMANHGGFLELPAGWSA